MSYLSRMHSVAHLDARSLIAKLSRDDVFELEEAEKNYGDSWKKRGGVGAMMMLARKWDRIEKALDPKAEPGDEREAPLAAAVGEPIPAWDILEALRLDTRPEGIIDDVRDLRRYLLLVEAEHEARVLAEREG